MPILLELLAETLKRHYKGLIGIGLLDGLILVVLGITYIYKGDICFQRWLDIFRMEAYKSIGIVVLVELILIMIIYVVVKKKKIEYAI